ncbi:MAG: phosphatidate cytidylyltransferase [Chloroflexi bacterium]|nr:phosphatidate cytidylyltransferase [Chloroflexota bacterium]
MDLRRYISGAILIVLVTVPAYFGGVPFFVLVLGAAGIAAFEYDGLARHGGHQTQRLLGAGLIALILADTAFPGYHLVEWGLPLAVMLSLVLPMRRADLSGALSGWGLTLAGALYIGVLLAQVLRLRQLEPVGLPLVALAAFVTWMNDSAAYVVGVRWGRRRLAPRISPKKSWEGALGGGVAGVLVGLLTGWLWLPGIPLWHVVLMSLLVVVAGDFGDLAESLIKRQVGVKDAGYTIPGHGGVLDRIDSMMYAFPAVTLYALWVLGLR